MPHTLTLFAFLTFLLPAATTDTQITGTVVDSEGRPLARVHVAVEDPETGWVRSVLTDRSGRFGVSGLQGGALYTVTATRIGFEAAREEVWAQEGAFLDVELRLVRRAIRIPPFEVIGHSSGGIEGVPGSATVLDSRALETGHPVSSSEVLRRVPGVNVRHEDAFGLHLDIGVRGLDPRRSSRLLLLEDGVPIALGPYGDPSAHFQPPVHSLEGVEVLKGSGQIVHGPQTVGGVINFRRARPPASPRASLSLSGGSEAFRIGHFLVGGPVGRANAIADYTHREANGPRAGWHHRVRDVSASTLLGVPGHHALSVRAIVYDEHSAWGETGLTQAEFEEDPFQNPSPHDAFLLERQALRAVYEIDLGRGVALTTRAYGQRVHRASWRQSSDSRDRFGSAAFEARYRCAPDPASVEDCGNQGRPRTYRFAGLEPRLNAVALAGEVEVRLDAGVRAHRESVVRRQVQGASFGARDGALVQDNALRTNAYSGFVQTRLTRRAWGVTPGIRLERIESENINRLTGDRVSDRMDRWLPGMAAAYEGIHATTLFLGAHQGFAPPRPADILDPDPRAGLARVDPEVSWNYEVGVRTRPHEALSLEVTAFRIDFRNQVIRGDLAGSEQRLVNAGRTMNEGIELWGAVDVGVLARALEGLSVDAAYTHLHRAEFTSDVLSSADRETPIRGRRVPYAPRHLAHGAVAYERAATRVRASMSYVGRQYSDDLNTRVPTEDGQRGILPGHVVVDLTVDQGIGLAGVNAFVSVRNVADRVYVAGRQNGVSVGMPRSVQVGLRWTH